MRAIRHWFDSKQRTDSNESGSRDIDWMRIIPFIALHLGSLAVIWVGVSVFAVTVAVALYLLRMFAITAFYHRFFAHKSFKTSRVVQLTFAVIGASATQRGPLWWAAHHRKHHRFADQPDDPHSPKQGFWWSHIGWFLNKQHFNTDYAMVPELATYPELRWLDRFDIAVPILLAVSLYVLGEMMAAWFPSMQTNGWQLVVWGYCISTIVLLHATLLINSLAHKMGSRRYYTPDHSRNNFWLALLTLGEGWHNNHHYHAASARQGFYWWEVDISYYILSIMNKLGLIWDMRTIPVAKRDRNHLSKDVV
ncbi:acyl-CoA desaturase [Methylophaga thiooxydans]|uniref:Fatty acid desaturase subfamily n=1 Tax=Methylophaga thiooxydans DMS010 TaxID=637616 RepID=C0N7M7_9GAMM|nr:acyl-CoA desaturase [Methylophaga thiooxydans]EEF79658.1 Fatty acid desaturase subfamily [Methylophaga thiooxydans DMS010]